MRYLLFVSLGAAAGIAGFVWLFTGNALYIALITCFLAGGACVFLRSRPVLRHLAVLLIAAGSALVYCIAYEALVLAPLEQAAGESEYTVEVCGYSEELESGTRSVEGRLRVGWREAKVQLYYTGEECFAPGDQLQFYGQLRWVGSARAELETNYYASRGIRYTAYLPESHACTKAEKFPIRFLPALAAHKAQELISRLYPERTAGYITALLTGSRAKLSALDQDRLCATGVYHTVAVSGLHVTILIGMLQMLFQRKRKCMAAFGIPVLCFFVLMTGASASAIRAAVMLAFQLLAPLMRRENDPPTTLGTAALLILLANPYAIASVSFQLSFLACAGILLFSERIARGMLPKRGKKKDETKTRRFLSKLLYQLVGILSVSLSAQLATAPLCMWYFGQVSVIAPLTNLFTSFAVTGAFASGTVSVLLGAIWLPLGIPFARLASVLARYLLFVVKLFARLPFAALYTFSAYTWIFILFLYAMLLVLLLSREKKRPFIPLSCSVIVLCVCLLLNAFSFDKSEFTFTALDVGQGQCLVLCSKGASVMIDCGGDSASETAQIAASYLASMGQTSLDILILTHYDSDHAGGVRALLERIDVHLIIGPNFQDDNGNRQRVEAAAEQYGTEVLYVEVSPAEIQFGSGRLTVYPPVAYGSDNEACLTVLATFGDYDILATGDMSIASEQLLLKMYDLPDIETLVAGHHGAKNATGEALLETTRPELVIISVGENNPYGHPAPETLARIAAAGAAVQRTDENGTITIRR